MSTRLTRARIATLIFALACTREGAPPPSDSAAAPPPDTASRRISPGDSTTSPDSTPTRTFRALGNEPFWNLTIGPTGLRFITPDDTSGIHVPPLTPSTAGDTLHWKGETERAAIDARIWRAQCSDGMSDRVWAYTAVVRIGEQTYHGCAESPAPSTRPVARDTA